LYFPVSPCDLHSFPTRRSSDLDDGHGVVEVGPFHFGLEINLVYAGPFWLLCGWCLLVTHGLVISEGYRRKVVQVLAYGLDIEEADRKSTRLNSSHVSISYAVFC